MSRRVSSANYLVAAPRSVLLIRTLLEQAKDLYQSQSVTCLRSSISAKQCSVLCLAIRAKYCEERWPVRNKMGLHNFSSVSAGLFWRQGARRAERSACGRSGCQQVAAPDLCQQDCTSGAVHKRQGKQRCGLDCLCHQGMILIASRFSDCGMYCNC